MKLIILFFFCFLVQDAAGKSAVLIRGLFPGAEGQEVRLLIYEDLISKKTREADATIIDEHGGFGLSVHIDEAQPVVLRIMHARVSFYVEPGQRYLLTFDPADPGTYGQGGSQHPLRQDFSYDIQNEQEGVPGLNRLTSQLNYMVADYLDAYVAGNIRASHRHSLALFRAQADSAFLDVSNPFVVDYVRYYLAYLERALHARQEQALISTYLADRPVLYHHPMYVDFVRTVMSTYMFGGSRSIARRDLYDAVNRMECYHTLIETLRQDSLLENERFREYALLSGLQQMLTMNDFSNRRVVSILAQVVEQTKIPTHATIAENITKQYMALQPGTPAPEFVLYDHEGKTIELNDFQGRPLYLFYWASWCPVSMAEFGPMTILAHELGSAIDLIGIFIDHDDQAVLRFTQDNDLPFPLLHFGNDYRMLDKYQVRSVPHYLLIAPDGTIRSADFLSPSAGAAAMLQTILEQK